MLLITKGISDWDGKSHPIRGFGIDLWHAVEFSRYERARILPIFVGRFQGDFPNLVFFEYRVKSATQTKSF